MAYLTGIPAATDLISNSQSQIQENFNQLNTQFSGNHNALTSVAANGHHTFITFDNSPAAPVSAGTVSNMYPSTITGAQEMVWGNAAGSTQITSGGKAIWKGGTGTGVVQTFGLTAAPASGASASTGSMQFGNGVAVMWGTAPINHPGGTGATTTIDFATTGFAGWPPKGFLNACFSCVVTGYVNANANSPVNVFSIAKDQFVVGTRSSTLLSITYFAIGN